jgi:tetratricopeptide (TPR) repeat protein
MSACIVVLYTTLLASAAGLSPQTAAVSDDRRAQADRLYAARETLERAREAAAIWSAASAAVPIDFESAWKLARAQYWIGGHVAKSAARVEFEKGVESARRASAAAPSRPEGYFWLAANMAGLAESQGISAGLKYRTPIREALERVLAIGPGWQQGSADRALGRWYYKVPRLFGGSKDKSEAHLRKSLTYNSNSTATWLFLADTLDAMGRDADARAALKRVLEVPVDPEWAPEDREFKAQARERLRGRS